MKKCRQRSVRVKSTVLICAMLLSSILPAALALGAEEAVDCPETDKVETVVVIESEEKGDGNKNINNEIGSKVKIDSGKNSFVENVEKVENDINDGDDLQGSGDDFKSDLPPPSDDIKNTIVKKEDNQKISITNPPDDDCASCDSGYVDTQDAACLPAGECSSICAGTDDIVQDKSQEPIRKQITKDEYDKFEDKFSSNNDEVIITPGLKLVTSAHDGWWIHADETAPKGTVTIAYKISNEYFMVTFTITGSGSHFIGDGRKSEGVNHIKVGFADAERGEDNPGKDDPGNTEPDPKDNSKKKQNDTIKENKKLKQNQGTDPEPKPDPDLKSDTGQDKPNEEAKPNPNSDLDKSNEGNRSESDAGIGPESNPGTGTEQNLDGDSSSEIDSEAEPEQAPVSNPEDDSSTNSESEDSDDGENKTAVLTEEGNNPSNDTPTREARTATSSSPKTGEVTNYLQLLAFVSAVIAVFSAAGLIRIRIEEI